MNLGVEPDMARFRNPRYAPESLERRLSPADLGVTPPPAEVEPIITPEIPPDQVPPDPSEPPIELIPPPLDPIVPA